MSTMIFVIGMMLVYNVADIELSPVQVIGITVILVLAWISTIFSKAKIVITREEKHDE